MDACTLGWADLQSFQYQKITEDLKLKREKKVKNMHTSTTLYLGKN